MEKTIQELVRQANIRIERIKSYGMQPITLKSPANSIEKFVEPKGTSREGQIKTWAQVRLEYDDITRNEYETAIRDFLQSDYGKQTYFKEAFAYYSEVVINTMIEKGFDDEYIQKLKKLSKTDFINAINYASELAKRDKETTGDSLSFYYYIIQYMDNLERE